jgi:CubicO group peptidase (beta-lactamase class C family)
MEVQGTCDARFERVRALFAEQMGQPGELGAGVAITLGGRRVVDLWGGVADAARTTAWTPDTIVNLFSTTKGMAAICAHRLVDQGKLDLDAPVARYWPEFAQADKGDLPVRFLLDHSAGLVAVDRPLPAGSMTDWTVMTEALAAQAPWWTPGTEHGYHALTFGWLVGEVVRRVSGRSIGAYFRDEIAGPLGADLWIGTPPEADARTAEIVMAMPQPGEASLMAEIILKAKPYALKAFMNPIPAPGGVNSRGWRGAEIPAANGHGSARALARIYGALANGGTQDGVAVLSQESIDRARTVQRSGLDNVLPLLKTRFGLGFQIGTDDEPIGPNPRAFGHSGMGGSFGFADPEAQLGFGYAMNRMENGVFLIGPRATALMNAAFECLR